MRSLWTLNLLAPTRSVLCTPVRESATPLFLSRLFLLLRMRAHPKFCFRLSVLVLLIPFAKLLRLRLASRESIRCRPGTSSATIYCWVAPLLLLLFLRTLFLLPPILVTARTRWLCSKRFPEHLLLKFFYPPNL
eukprot:Rmarinus@m.25181